MSRRLGLWVTVLALPLAALALLAAAPGVDRRWEHHPSHFWLVLTVAGRERRRSAWSPAKPPPRR